MLLQTFLKTLRMVFIHFPPEWIYTLIDIWFLIHVFSRDLEFSSFSSFAFFFCSSLFWYILVPTSTRYLCNFCIYFQNKSISLSCVLKLLRGNFQVHSYILVYPGEFKF
uniref:Uncharacterized protein n=1 Tax=Cacopsylla melanoneura TaxID=428564 RepID=A0A8D8U1J4_9HEMI